MCIISFQRKPKFLSKNRQGSRFRHCAVDTIFPLVLQKPRVKYRVIRFVFALIQTRYWRCGYNFTKSRIIASNNRESGWSAYEIVFWTTRCNCYTRILEFTRKQYVRCTREVFETRDIGTSAHDRYKLQCAHTV